MIPPILKNLRALTVFAFISSGEAVPIENRDGRVIDISIISLGNESVRVKKADGAEFEIQLATLTDETVTRLKAQSKAPTVGTTVLTKVGDKMDAVTADEAKLYGELRPLLDDWRSDSRFSPDAEKTLKLRSDCDTILGSLASIHSNLAVKDRCERLLAVILGQVEGADAFARLGAVDCLSQIPGAESTAALFIGLSSGLSEGLELQFMTALGERCTGDVMVKLLEMFMSSDPQTRYKGGYTLSCITTKAQLAELKERAKGVVNTTESLDRLNAVFALSRNLKD